MLVVRPFQEHLDDQPAANATNELQDSSGKCSTLYIYNPPAHFKHSVHEDS